MAIDPVEKVFRRRKRETLINEIQAYMENQANPEIVGKLGHREVHLNRCSSGKIPNAFKKALHSI